jgi:hypothetical protein
MSAQIQCSCCQKVYLDLLEVPLEPLDEHEVLTWICRSCLRDPVHVVPCAEREVGGEG